MATTNSNSLFQQAPVPQALDPLISEQITTTVEAMLNSCLWYRIQCVDCETAAQYLDIETDTVRQWIKSGKLPASKPGREWMIRLKDIDSMLAKTATIIRLDKRFKKSKPNQL